jgi:hypothetical protein
MAKKKVPGLDVYFAFERKDAAKREVEGYCFVNEDVGSGLVWDRAAMEAATDDYMRWANIREMHQASAVGTCAELTWDEKGCRILSTVVDDAAWKKVETGVYKGFSARIVPIQMRGNRVTQCKWIENSLVDRPADPDCPFDSVRVATGQEYEIEMDEEVTPTPESEAPVTEVPATEERAAFADRMPQIERNRLLYAAFDLLQGIFWDAIYGENGDETDLRTSVQEFADYAIPLAIEGGQERGEAGGDARMEGLTTDLAASRAAFDALEVEAGTMRAQMITMESDLTAARAQIEQFRANPVQKAVRYPVALERSFSAGDTPDSSKRAAYVAELSDLQDSLAKEPDPTKRQQGAVRISRLKSLIAEG